MSEHDAPQGFGYKMSWLAIRSTNTQAIIEAMHLREPQQVSWEQGLRKVYDDRATEPKYLFITPPISGWTLVVGFWIANPGGDPYAGDSNSVIENLLARLSTQFGEAQQFLTHRVSEAHEWRLARDGVVLRSFSYAGDGEGVITDKGERTPVEQSLGLNWETPEESDDYALMDELYANYNPPNEQHVISVAGGWSVDPTTLDERTDITGTCILAKTPAIPDPNNPEPIEPV